MNAGNPLSDASPGGPIHATLYCRPSTSTASAIDRYCDRLEQLRDRGIVDAVEVREWTTRVSLDGSAETSTERAYERLTDWASDNGVTLEPAFSVRTNESAFTGEARMYLVTPIACLALEGDDGLLVVYPHAVDGDVYTVEDGLALLAASDAGRVPDHGHEPAVTEAEE